MSMKVPLKATVSFRWDWPSPPCLVQFNLVARIVMLYNFLEHRTMIVFELIFYHQIIVSVTETSSKIASTLCQKFLTIFFVKKHVVVWFGPYDFVQISPACGPNTYQIMYGETLDFQCQHQQCPIWKSIFAVNLPLKLFRATVDNADIGNLKSLHTFLKNCLYHMLVKFEQNRMVQTTRKFELFDEKPGFL